MAVEIEIKARLDNIEETEAIVRSFAIFSRSFDRSDTYFHDVVSKSTNHEFRLRRDGNTSVVCYKEKKLDEGIEVNLENEFFVIDAEKFEAFARYLGYVVFIKKRKTGRSYKFGKATIELLCVEGLGNFIEIEELLDTADETEISAARNEIRAVLQRAAVPQDRIEPRYYIDLLAGL
jgi:adenylate cyclase, class 2